MKKSRRLAAAQHPGELNLAASRRQQVIAADDEIDALFHVVHRHRELEAPVPVSILAEHVAALFERTLLLDAVPQIDEPFDRRGETHTQGASFHPLEASVCASAGVPQLRI